jgi:6-pyruvoyl-tetrahydropterin synthase
MIKNWKLFLESNEDDNEMFKNAEDLKTALRTLIKPLLIGEILLRLSEDKNAISATVELITKLFIESFKVAIEDRDISNEQKDFFIEIFENSVNGSKKTFIEISFTKGIEDMVDKFIVSLEKMKKEMESESGEWREEKEVDYSDLSKSELNSLIDDALDKRDFERVAFLSKYIKESVDIKSKEDLEELCYKIANLFIDCIYKYI